MNPISLYAATSAGAALITSGTIIPVDNSPVELEILTGGTVLVLTIGFYRDERVSEARWQIKLTPDNPLRLELAVFNINSPSGRLPSTPVRLWSNEQSVILGVFRFKTQPAAPPSIHFSFYSKKQEETK